MSCVVFNINPEEREALYYVRAIDDKGFTVQFDRDNKGDIPKDKNVTLFAPNNLIPVKNFYVWGRHRENNYEIDEIYSN